MFSWRAILSLLCAILLMPISSILVKFAKQHRLETNEPPFLPFAASMIIEFVKGVMCLLIYACCGPSSGDGGSSSDKSNDDDGEPISAWQHVKNSFMYAIPATLYAVDNNLFFVVLRLVTPATLHLLANIKIVFVALLFRFALRRAVNRVQWAALLLLIVGLIVARLDDPHATSAVSASATRSGAFIVANASAASSASPPNSALSTLAPSALSTGSVQQPSQFSAITQGFLLVVLMTACSSVANIALEHLYKTHRQHMLLQQFQLYLYGVALNLACLLAYDYHTIATEGVLRGFNAFVWAVVAASSFTGIAVSFVLKYSDNIGNVFAHAGALVVTALISAVLFDFRITPAFVCSCIIVKVCCFIYHAAATPDASFESGNEMISSSSSASALPDGEASISASAPVEYARVALDDASGPDGDQSFDQHSRIELQSVSSFSARSGANDSISNSRGFEGGIHVLEDDADHEHTNESSAHSELAAMPQFSSTARNSPASATVSFAAKGPASGVRPKNAVARQHTSHVHTKT